MDQLFCKNDIVAEIPTGRDSYQSKAVKEKTLYPQLDPFDHGYLDVGDGHSIYYEQCGRRDGLPALFVHGGPGAGGDLNARRFFDPSTYRIVVFDQRGAGRSRPAASTDANTTWHLVRDMELLRGHLKIGRWLVFGGSWGSTLSLAYAQQHPNAVSALVLRGIFLLRRKELAWFYQEGAGALLPEEWNEFLALIPEEERDDMLSAYHKRLFSPDPEMRLKAAIAWSVWEGAASFLTPRAEQKSLFGKQSFALALARIEAHFFVNDGFFLSEGQLLEGVDRIRHIPAVIVQGRHDIVCPMETAWELHKCWPEADFRVVNDAGHSAYEAGVMNELINATDAFRKLAAG